MSDDDLTLDRINRLADEEHRLREMESTGTLGADHQLRLREVELLLDQCWDLLRQRRARRRAGLDPDDASPRRIDTVEGYEQ